MVTSNLKNLFVVRLLQVECVYTINKYLCFISSPEWKDPVIIVPLLSPSSYNLNEPCRFDRDEIGLNESVAYIGLFIDSCMAVEIAMIARNQVTIGKRAPNMEYMLRGEIWKEGAIRLLLVQ